MGSLLRGCVGRDPVAASGVASLVRAGGMLRLLLAPSIRDGLDGLPTNVDAVGDAVAGAFGPFGLAIVDARPATPAEIVASGSTWARRLGTAGSRSAPTGREVLLVRLVRR